MNAWQSTASRWISLIGSQVLLLSVAHADHADRKWPFTAPEAPSIPFEVGSGQVDNEIDAFILKSLKANNLSFAPEASKRALIRRLYYDLIGLPPSPEKINAFVNDERQVAYEELVDDLLKDPRHGERWARFWLDLARYADTAGYEGDPDLPHAWRYRDYVIDSINKDKPYDQFIKEQIAGDEFKEIMGAGELPLPEAEKVVAMTFLRLAPFTEPRGDETRHEMLSEMTSTVSSVFLGLTVGCAKCHDHKYDPIPIKDFYRMKAFFSTVQIQPPDRGDIYQIGGALPADFYKKETREWVNQQRDRYQSLRDEFAKLQSELKARAATTTSGSGFGIQSTKAGNDYFYHRRNIDDGELYLVVAQSDGEQWRFFVDGEESKNPGTLSGENRGTWIGDLGRLTSLSLGQHTRGSGKPQGVSHQGLITDVLIYDKQLDEDDHKTLNRYFQDKYKRRSKTPSDAFLKEGLRFWLSASDVDGNPQSPNPAPGSRIRQWTDLVGQVALTSATPEQAPTLKETGPNRHPGLYFEDSFLSIVNPKETFSANQEGSIVMILSVDHEGEGYGLEIAGENGFLTTFVHTKAGHSDLDFEKFLHESDTITPEERVRYTKLKQQTRFIAQHLKRLEPKAMSLRHSFGPPYEPGIPTTRVMLRGEYDNPGEIVQAGFPSCITGNEEPAEIRLDPFKRWPTRSRRMALAEWIASENNPLTARVMVNRLWFRHFGRGFVETPSDFGALSGGPSHPELLDWLALRFMKEGWSLKAIHKLMVMSRTYRQSSLVQNQEADKIDPQNKLLWRFNRRRLEAEAVRDAVLKVSGRLNPEVFGIPIFPALPDGIEDRVKYNESKWATDTGPDSRKRSVYIYQQRTLNMPLMQNFDGLVCEDSIPKRQASVTPLQALSMYNGPLVQEEAKHFARRLETECPQTAQARVDRAILLAYGRNATPQEIEALTPMATTSEELIRLCRILLNTSEFIYVD